VKTAILVAIFLAVTPGIPSNCVGCDLARRDFHGADFSGVNYVGVDLSESNLRGARFERAILQGIDFNGADLRDADFRNAKLCWDGHGKWDDGISCPDFRNANVQDADFRGALLCDVRDKQSCKPVDRATLQTGSRSDLAGANLP